MGHKKKLVINVLCTSTLLCGISTTNIAFYPNVAKAAQLKQQNTENNLIENEEKSLEIINNLLPKGFNTVVSLAKSTLEPTFKSLIQNGKIDVVNDVIKNLVMFGLSSVPIAGSTLSFMGDTLWSVAFPENTVDSMEKFENSMKNIVKQEIKTYDQATVKAELQGLRNSQTEYNTHLEAWRSSKTATNDPVKEFTAVNNSFRTTIPKFQKDGYQLGELKLFSIIATMHLAILHDGVRYGEQWGLTSKKVSTYKKELQTAIKNYTEYVTKVYKDGLKLVEENADKTTFVEGQENTIGKHMQSDDVQQYKGTGKWNMINAYNRQITLDVLDLASSWKYMNVDSYPEGAKTELARFVYSDIVGSVQKNSSGRRNNGETFEGIKNRILNEENNMGVLQSLLIKSYDRIDAIKPTYIDSNGKTYNGPLSGGDGGESHKIDDLLNNPITTVRTWSQLVPFALEFERSNDSRKDLFGKTNDHRIETKEYSYAGQKLGYVKGFGMNGTTGFRGLDAVVFGFIPKDFSIENKINPILNTPTVIPAQKWILKNGNCMPVEELLNGGNAMKLGTNSEVTYKINLEKAGKYKVRVQARANNNTTIQINSQNMSQPINSKEISLYDGPTLNLKSGENTINLRNNHNDVVVSQIEIIPVQNTTSISKLWQQKDGKTYYFSPIKTDKFEEGEMVTGWFRDDDERTYYFSPIKTDKFEEGEMITGWFQDDDEKTYYFNPTDIDKFEEGEMMTGWFQDDDGKIYYFSPTKTNVFKEGEMVTGDVDIKDANGRTTKTYHFDEKGVCTNFID
ncbi:insecticidal delta-endotoxin Cry8Ea1 family protein [Bacillus thuringiensis]|nr:insecticidal delta-endotoxin Cry8Ea1 family protein [Bacillus thuringiensis]MED2760447.1 insecticidal delta-endotoxin Cry8Ea1 family protein [Bacillus thuringiensis]MED2771754.1 insecticidal delta-endotoxin Cry8Ea1 family protein [Bacillus thuringiensis]MED2778087.1 insecticidal delta-endotoxin Cry8Ea1 family protein [Bacillus thuringiensis]MED2784222.1 insecticidal delta-endotoxin Cry8Ea1 family protein [Bacillus thuringiensis]